MKAKKEKKKDHAVGKWVVCLTSAEERREGQLQGEGVAAVAATVAILVQWLGLLVGHQASQTAVPIEPLANGTVAPCFTRP